MIVKLVVDEKEKKKIDKLYDQDVNWRLLSHCLTSVYNWAVPNKKNRTVNIRVKTAADDDLAGWFNYGQTLYVNPEYNTTFDEFTRTLFHEFCHWNQFWIDGRPGNSMVTKRKPGSWDLDNAEAEAEAWEIIGEKILELYKSLNYIKEVHEASRKKHECNNRSK